MITDTAQTVLEKRYFKQGEKRWEDLADRVSSYFADTDNEAIRFKESDVRPMGRTAAGVGASVVPRLTSKMPVQSSWSCR